MTTFSPSHLSFSTVSARLESKQRRASIGSSSSSSSTSTSHWPERAGGGEAAGSRMPWKMREIEKLFRDGRAGEKGKEKSENGMEKEKVERVLSEYIRDKRSSARTTKHIDRKLTMLERNVADLGLHACFDAARKRDGKLGNGPLLEPLELEVVEEGESGGGGLPVYSEKGNV